MFPVVILCGGLATRLRPVTETIPKALIELNGEPFLAHQLRLLRSRGVREVVLCVGYLGEQIQTYAGDGSRFGLHVACSFDGPTLLGTAGAVRRALPLLPRRFFVLYGDSYLPCNYQAVAEAFDRSGKRALMTVFHNEGLYDTSNVEFAGGRILSYSKKVRTPRMRHIDYGLGVFERSVFEELPAGERVDLAAVYEDLLRSGDLAGCEIPERFYEIGSPEGIRETAEYLSRLQKEGSSFPAG